MNVNFLTLTYERHSRSNLMVQLGAPYTCVTTGDATREVKKIEIDF